MLTLVFMILLTYYITGNIRRFGICNIFLALGSLTFAIGPFVAPVMTVGMCLVLYIQLEKDNCDRKTLWKFVVLNTISWIIGYVASMLFKQLLAEVLLGKSDGISEALLWFGAEMGIQQRFSVLRDKLIRCFTPAVIKVPIFILLIVILLILCCKWRRKTPKTLMLGFVALYPFIWVLLVSRHSIHLFTSNIFTVTIYAIISILLNHTSKGEQRKDMPVNEDGY